MPVARRASGERLVADAAGHEGQEGVWGTNEVEPSTEMRPRKARPILVALDIILHEHLLESISKSQCVPARPDPADDPALAIPRFPHTR
jgi:hypothetical protein